MMVSRRQATGILGAGSLGVILAPGALASPLDGLKLDPRARVDREETVTIGPEQAHGTDVECPRRAVFTLDFAVQARRQLLLLILTAEQYRAVLKGLPPAGEPPLHERIQGTASRSVTLRAGEYFVGFRNAFSSPVLLTYRTSWIDL